MKEGWKIVKLKNICDKASSNVAQKDLDNNNGEYPIYGASGFIKNVDFFHYDKPYIGIVKDGSGVGRVNIYPANSSLLGTLQYILPKTGYELGFVYYALQSLNLSKYKVGAAIPHIYFRDYGEKELSVPPLEEQHRIVGILDATFAKIDALKKNAEENLKNAKALFQQVLAQELQPKEGWVEKKLGEVAYMKAGDFVKASDIHTNSDEGLFPCYGGNGLRGYVSEPNQEGDYCLIGRQGALCGCIHRVSGIYRTTEHAVIVKPYEEIPTTLVYYLLVSLNLNKYATGAAQPGLSVKNISENVIISIPPLSEQHRIVSILDTLSEKCRRLEQVAQQTIRECDALKQSILRQAFSGEL